MNVVYACVYIKTLQTVYHQSSVVKSHNKSDALGTLVSLPRVVAMQTRLYPKGKIKNKSNKKNVFV